MKRIAVLAAVAAIGLGSVAQGADLTGELSEEEYLATELVLQQMTSATLDDLLDRLNAYGDDATDRIVTAEVAAETGVFEAVYAAAREVDPPAKFAATNVELVTGYQLLAKAGEVLREGVVTYDADAIEESSRLMDESKMHAALATDLMKAALAE